MIIETIQVGPLKVNCYIVGCEETGEAVVIDAGGDTEKILEKVRSRGLRVKYIVNTHGHFDHVGGNRSLIEATGAELMVHPKDAFLLPMAAAAGADFGVQVENSPEPDRFLADGMDIEFGVHRLRVIHTPGHSPGGCCLYCKNEGVVFTGDTLFNGSIGRYDLPGGLLPVLMESLRERVMTLPAETRVYPGHGPSTSISHERVCNPHIPKS
jgi:glyoxylase-like metal-dependent hydrolase (beta-lactamase superfamily II)